MPTLDMTSEKKAGDVHQGRSPKLESLVFDVQLTQRTTKLKATDFVAIGLRLLLHA